MREIIISNNEAGKKLDKFLSQYFTGTTMGFLYKMLRKKNITLNKKKATGKEVLKIDDVISVFFSDETFDKFSNKYVSDSADTTREYERAYKSIGNLDIIYEDDHILLVNKTAGLLTQKSDSNDLSLNEWLLGYLLNKNAISKSSISTFRPSVCNRLDRNTSGIVICSKSLIGAREMARLLKSREIHKFYRTIVIDKITEDKHIKGYLIKDKKTNQVKLFDKEVADSVPIDTSFKVLLNGQIRTTYGEILEITELEVELHTGKTHQIRAHLASIGHPIIGDTKYGNKAVNMKLKNDTGLKSQLLHSQRIEFPGLEGELEYLSGKTFMADIPDQYKRVKDMIFL